MSAGIRSFSSAVTGFMVYHIDNHQGASSYEKERIRGTGALLSPKRFLRLHIKVHMFVVERLLQYSEELHEKVCTQTVALLENKTWRSRDV